MAANGLRQSLKLYVGNIPWTIGSAQLKTYFSKFGHVSSAQVVFDKNSGLSKNFGFVTFANQESYTGATNFTTHKLEGNTLKIQPTAE